MKCTPNAGGFGATLDDLDLSASSGDNVVPQLMALLYRYRYLVIRNQDLDEESYSAFGHHWGKPIFFFDPRLRDTAHPELIVIHNRPDTPEAQRNVALHWHVDGSYEDPPASTTLLFAVEGPEAGNETLFCDMVAAYAALPVDTKGRIEGLVVIHGVGDERLLLAGEHRGRGEIAHTRPTVGHRLAGRHPVTGKRMLYAPSGSPRGIVGMDEGEAIDLLIELKKHATQERFTSSAAARTRDILIWDNYAVMHSATPTHYSDRDGERRFIYRFSTRDLPASAAFPIEEGAFHA